MGFSEYKGKYSYTSVNPRHLPADDKILWWGDRIECDRWQWFYWMVVTYGMRPSETFFCYPLEKGIIQVEPTKTNEVSREAYPLHWRWPDQFNLMNFKRPNITFRRPEEISQRAGKYFGKRGSIDLPFTFTDLRHCWARRATELGLDPETAARSLGHSLEIHQRIYKAWIGQQVYRRKFLDLIDRN